MKYRVIIQPPAHADIEEAYQWIRQDSPTYADRWHDSLTEAVNSLEAFPERCGLAPESEFFDEEIRQLLYGVYRVLFVVRERTVYVLHVRHGAQEPLEPEDES